MPISDSSETNTFLIDTQADLSLIKINKLIDRTRINTENITTLTGITEYGKMDTIGTIDTFLLFGDHMIPHSLHVVPNDFFIPCDGIIGKDFLATYKCVINYEKMQLSFYIENVHIKISLLGGPSENEIILPPRCVVMRKFLLNSKTSEKDSQFVEAQDICEGVLTQRCITFTVRMHTSEL